MNVIDTKVYLIRVTFVIRTQHAGAPVGFKTRGSKNLQKHQISKRFAASKNWKIT